MKKINTKLKFELGLIMGLLIGYFLANIYLTHIQPRGKMIQLLEDSRIAWKKYGETEAMMRRKDDSLEVFKLDHAIILLQDRLTSLDTIIIKDIDTDMIYNMDTAKKSEKSDSQIINDLGG